MRIALVYFISFVFASFAGAQAPIFTESMITAAEKSNFERTSTFAEVVSVIDALGAATELMHRETLLVTQEGKSVPIVVLANPPISSPEQAQLSGKPVIYLQGNIHGGEVEGKEASLILMRDVLFGDKQHLLNNQILVFVPIYNADGNDAMDAESRPNQEMSPLLAGQRHAHGYDLNRDGMALEAPESAALMKNVILRWDPDLLVDLHTTNGTWHGYSLTYAPSYNTAGEPETSTFTANVMLPSIKDKVKEKFDLEFNWYGGFDYRDWPPKELRTYHHAPRYLTNQMGLRNRMAILSETFSHDRFYKRVHAANVFIEEILEFTAINGHDIRRINRAADERVVNAEAGQLKGVVFEMAPLEEKLDLLSYKYIPFETDAGETDFVRSSELIVTPGVLNYNRFDAKVVSRRPEAYVLPGRFPQVAEKLKEHGITVEVISNNQVFNGEAFVVSAVTKQNFVQNGHRNSLLEGEFTVKQREFGAGDFYIPMDQRLANLAFYLLEPQADDGLVYWNFFDGYLEGGLDVQETLEYPVFKVLP
ncbi:MAG: M14 family metallopeptidase [Pseudohongiellaceae bacterium]